MSQLCDGARGSCCLCPRLWALVHIWAAAPQIRQRGQGQTCPVETWYPRTRPLAGKALLPSRGMLEGMAGGKRMRKEVATRRAKAAVPKAREQQAWAVQPRQERALLCQVTLQRCVGPCDRGEAAVQEGQGAAEKVPAGGQPVIQPPCGHRAGGRPAREQLCREGPWGPPAERTSS